MGSGRFPFTVCQQNLNSQEQSGFLPVARELSTRRPGSPV
ncbi:hypothetical protein MNBD_ACTINO01-529, partial [hydrothermal vent metagenome]